MKIPKNTRKQIAFLKAQEEVAQEEATLPIWEVVITGDETLWVPRSGVNLATEDTEFEGVLYRTDDPMPWRAPNRGSCQCRARDEAHAAEIALRANPDYHTVESVTRLG